MPIQDLAAKYLPATGKDFHARIGAHNLRKSLKVLSQKASLPSLGQNADAIAGDFKHYERAIRQGGGLSESQMKQLKSTIKTDTGINDYNLKQVKAVIKHYSKGVARIKAMNRRLDRSRMDDYAQSSAGRVSAASKVSITGGASNVRASANASASNGGFASSITRPVKPILPGSMPKIAPRISLVK